METVNNVASAASKLIWGEGEQAQERTTTNETGGLEPLSGEQGKGTVSEPFDKGNSENPISGERISAASPSPGFGQTSTTTGGISHPENETSKTGDVSAPSTSTSTSNPGPNPTSAAAGGVPHPEHETSKTGVVGSMGSDPKGSDVRPTESAAHTGAPPESGAAPTQKQQGAANPTDEPEKGESKSKSTMNVDDIDGEEALKKKDPNDHSGEPMHMHGGDGGSEEKKKTKLEERRESKAGQEGGQELGKEEHGTGEQWVKSTGLAAEGGDFDATKPGAGREADRLLEQKGIHKSKPDETAKDDTSTASPTPSGTKEKVSLADKVKNKLHIGHKDKP
ncbi:uncharacterized protein BDZ99DRAFT_457448 [Mytilinidion resinicola]|uniref:Glycine-rich cell wall structural protein 1 n=1 Tax=Mytilinidion resinicola TaxID=574789 RepID=A0A6A6ZAF6_9PEZI|nr:uncharacterized protein BDZ99DRAFT_457448 [Mytilinidion resinicola]KAF2817713.1 hypothetical protein BDZ99DRAFT_457448 [Mytilinidion resinicola]